MSEPDFIPLIDLAQQHRSLRAEILEAVGEVIDSAQFVLGDKVAAFEQDFASAHAPDAEAVGVNSGTSALHLALLALGVGEGDEVITSPYTFLATAEAIRYAGARPVFVDIDERTHTLDPARLETAVTARTKAVIPVHIFGQTADMEPILEIARRRGLAVIEDAAQAHLAEYAGRKAGVMGDIGCFSFYPSKNLGACGEGGLALTRNPELAAKLRMLRDWGQREKGRHAEPGFNYRMDGMQGAILQIKLRRLPEWTQQRRRHAKLYGELLQDRPVLRLPSEAPGRRHVYHLYAVRSPRRDELRQHLAAAGVGSGVHYPTPVHLLPTWSHLGCRPGDFAQAEALANEQLSLPMYPELTAAQVERVAAAVNAFGVENE